MKLFVNVAIYYVQERLNGFYKTINALSEIKNVKIIINSNINFDVNLPIHVSNLADPYHLTWEHKKYMQEFLDSDYTHYAYLEGNVEVTKKTFNYWNKTRQLFKRNNLNFIPAIHRVQVVDGQTYSLDCTHHVRNVSGIEVEGQKFVSLAEPYQGMFIMDREMVEEHMQSDYFNLGQKHTYGIRESANLGNMYVNIPSGYQHRAMIPLNNFSDCLVSHYGTNYHRNPNSPHAKIKIEELFNG
jgi:hypothetical protein